MDVLAVEEAVRAAVEAVRGGDGPHLVELKTYRFRAHSLADPDLYRTKEEVENWRTTRDPIQLFVRQQEIDDATVEQLEDAVATELDAAIAFAEAGPVEPVETLEEHVYTPGSAP